MSDADTNAEAVRPMGARRLVEVGSHAEVMERLVDDAHSALVEAGADGHSVEPTWWVVIGRNAFRIPVAGKEDKATTGAALAFAAAWCADAIVYVWDEDKAVFPRTEEAWVAFREYRKNGGTIEEHPEAQRAVVGRAWTHEDGLQYARPIEGEHHRILYSGRHYISRSLASPGFRFTPWHCHAAPADG